MTSTKLAKKVAANSEVVASMPRPLLRLDNVSIRYPERTDPAVKHVNLTVSEGELVLFLGPSGCGKSTLAMACAHLIPSSVEGEVSGDVWRADEIAGPGGVAMVFQDPDTQFCMLQVGDEVGFGLENRQVPRERMAQPIQSALSAVGLNVGLGAEHAKFSGGMKQKLAIASALATDAKLLVLDEPTANLDPLSTRLVFDTIAQLRASGQTMVVIEHKFDLLLPVADRVVLFGRDGTVHREGAAAEVVREEWAWMVREGVVASWKSLNATTPSSPETGVRDAEVWLRHSMQAHTERKHPSPTPEAPGATEATHVTEAAEAAARLESAGLSYGEAQVWQDLTLAIPEGSFVAVVGPNGSGKSTLLQALAGLQKLTAGAVSVLGHEVARWNARERFRAISYCFQNPEFQFVFERVGDELANRVVADDVPEDVKAGLGEFGLGDLADQSPYGLSQGQKRRLSVACMLRDPHELYLLDEPTFGQDAHTQTVIMQKLTDLHAMGRTIVMSTHDMDLVRQYATHVLVLAEGSMLYFGPPGALFERIDILRRAHLLDDVDGAVGAIPTAPGVPENHAISKARPGQAANAAEGPSSSGIRRDLFSSRRMTPAAKLNPGLHLMTVLVNVVIGMFAFTLPAAIGLFALPIVLMLTIGRIGAWSLVKRYAVFILFYLLYIWSFVAFSRVPPGAAHVQFLWWNLSYVGLMNGLVLAFRMLGAVGFGILLVSTTDMTDLLVSLCQNFRVPPRLSYGVLAGIRFMPLFQEEWKKLRQARMIRGKDAKWAAYRPVTYALPILSQAIRLSERVAIAMEARGFVDQAAERWDGRTYYRQVGLGRWDFVYTCAVLLVTLAVVIVGNHL